MALQQNERRLVELTRFGSNPGALKCWLYLPSILAPKASLVVALHGCTQSAADYDHGSGWTQLAEKKGFAVLFAEQQNFNNGNRCFNWFEPGDTARDAGEALSISEMIKHVIEAQGIDPGRVFITGLSAGGAMAHVMLATYPELFSGGAIIGGLPYGVASNVGQAFERMQGRNAPGTTQLQSALMKAAPRLISWPKISVWHGTHDHTVKPINATQIVDQWRGVHQARDNPDKIESAVGYDRKIWQNSAGDDILDLYIIKGMGHGVALSAGAKAPLGNVGPFMLETGISSTMRIARSWELADDTDLADAEGKVATSKKPHSVSETIEAAVAKAMAYATPGSQNKKPDQKSDGEHGVGKVINDALRAAGLMR